MGSTLDAFDTLCQQVFLINNDTTSMNDTSTNNTMPSPEESALSLVSRAQVYELPLSYTQLPSGSESVLSLEKQDRKFYRIHLETIEDPVLQQTIHSILVQAIDPTVLLVLPFDRNLSGYSTKTRTEVREATLDAPIILDMEGIPSTDDQTANSAMNDRNSSEKIDNKTMLLLPTKEWLRMNARIRHWRAESHRVKAAQREVVLDGLLYERWKPATSTSSLSYSNLPPLTSSSSISSPPPTSGSLNAAIIPPAPLPPLPATTSTASSPASSSRPSTVPQTTMPSTRLSHYKQPLQEHQLESLVQFMVQYGGEPSAASILRGVLELIQRQLTETKVLSWTFDRANLTEQKPEVTIAFLDLVARLGLEMVNTDVKQQQREQEDSISGAQQSLVAPASLVDSKSFSSTASQVTAVESPEIASSTELTWTFGSKIDDRRLEYWVHHLLQSSLPVLKMDDQSLLPSSATFTNSTSNTLIPTHQHGGAHQRSNPIPLDIRKRFLKESHTIPAGTIQVLTNSTGLSSTHPILRDRAFVLSTSKYAMSGPPGNGVSGASSSGLFVQRVKRDVKDLARWASTCGGRLDWIWAWLFSSFQRSRRGSSGSGAGSTARKPRPNDENV